MHTITAVTGILAGAALALAGCSSSTPEPIEVTGTQDDCSSQLTAEGFDADCTMNLSDARLSGPIHVEFTADDTGDIVEFVGTAEITNDGGAWTADCTGTLDETNDFTSFDCVYVGSGDYDGMTYDSHVEGTSVPSEASGTLTEG